MKNQDLKSGLFGSVGENMVAFELAKRNWYIYRPYFDTRIDFIAQKFICQKCFSEWESKQIVSCSNSKCKYYGKELNQKSIAKTRKCSSANCNFIFDKYLEMNKDPKCPKCNRSLKVIGRKRSGQRNYLFKCNICKIGFTSQTRSCVKCGSETIEHPVCKACRQEIVPKIEKCSNPACDSNKYAMIFRTVQVKSSHEEERKGTIAFNFKIQDLFDDERHFLVVYSRTFENYKEKHNYWVMTVKEFKDQYVKNTASITIYQNNRVHPPSKESKLYFNEKEYNKVTFELQKVKKGKIIKKLENWKINAIH